MLLAFNMLFWSDRMTEQHFPIFAEIKRAGYDGIEIPIFGGAPDNFEEIGRAARDNGLRVTAVTVMPDAAHDCISSDSAARAGGLQHLKWVIDCLSAAGGELLCGPFHQPLGVFSGDPPTPSERANVVSVHKDAAAYAARHNIKLSVEALNRFECYVLNTVADAADIVRKVGAPNYGLLYDTFHANIEEKDPVGVIAPNLAQINHVHFSENDRGTPGKGHVPWAATMKALKQGGYDDWCVIEAFGRALPGLAAATRVWRDFYLNREEVYQFGGKFLREQWANA
jgi:D-psicose/D-tagatose/L-ribulose 3-epimerase